MQDIKVAQDNLGNFDFIVDETNHTLKTVDGLESALDFQIFVDKRSTLDEVGNPRARQGWLGDLYTKENNYEVGSFVYLKNQSRNTVNDQNELVAYVKDGLQYFISNNICKDVKVGLSGNLITANIIIDNNNTLKYNRLWSNTHGN